MGIATVAVYSDADARSPHVLMADESVRLGPPPAGESYLLADLILCSRRRKPARTASIPAMASCPNATSFAEGAVPRQASPLSARRPSAIAAMGDKIEIQEAGARPRASTSCPVSSARSPTPSTPCASPGEIGYPVMMKASAGGGGKGMRLAYYEQDVREGFEATKREGLASFGDDRVFIEKFIESPRHIEIQVVGDQHGNIVYLGERECSIQRRHQKVVEEAPSPFVTAEDAQGDGRAGGRARRARWAIIRAGTVELIVSGRRPDRPGLLLPRDEHPAPGRASGHRGDHRPRPGRTDDPGRGGRAARASPRTMSRSTGWAIENRVCAEDPYRGFLPSTGRLVRYRSRPAGAKATMARRRADGDAYAGSMAREGGEVSMFYDPMIAKLITWAPTRDEAVDAQIAALDRVRDRRARQQYRFRLGDDAAPALPRGRADHGLHRRGIS